MSDKSQYVLPNHTGIVLPDYDDKHKKYKIIPYNLFKNKR